MKPMANAVQGTVIRDATFESQPLRSQAIALVGPRGAAVAKPETVAIIARMNAPLVVLLYALMSRNIPCQMLNRDQLAEKLLKLVRKLNSQVSDGSILIFVRHNSEKIVIIEFVFYI